MDVPFPPTSLHCNVTCGHNKTPETGSLNNRTLLLEMKAEIQEPAQLGSGRTHFLACRRLPSHVMWREKELPSVFYKGHQSCHGGPTLRIPSKPATSQRPHPQMMTLWTPSFRPWASTCDFGSTAQSKSHASGSVDVPLCRVLGLDLQSVRVWCGPHGKFVAEPVLLSPLFLSVGRCSHCELTDRVCGVRYV